MAPYWGAAGEAYYLVVEGSMVALLYFAAADVVEPRGPGGEPAVADPGWCWVAVDDPDDHFQVATAADELEEAKQAAVREIEEYLKRQERAR